MIFEVWENKVENREIIETFHKNTKNCFFANFGKLLRVYELSILYSVHIKVVVSKISQNLFKKVNGNKNLSSSSGLNFEIFGNFKVYTVFSIKIYLLYLTFILLKNFIAANISNYFFNFFG